MRAAGPQALAWALTALIALLLASPAAGTPALHVIPFPGTPDASPSSQIIFSSLRPSDLKTVTVIGSSTGVHTGHIKALPDGAGTAFLPHSAFTPGERVSVTATLGSPAAGTASGDPGATALRFSFTVSTPASPPTTASRAIGSRGTGWLGQAFNTASSTTQSFHSAPDLHPLLVSATSDSDSASGDIFLTAHTPPSSPPVQNGPMILDSRGHLVWFHPVRGYATNLEVQRYRGQAVLTYFHWPPAGSANSADVILGRAYRTVATLHGAEGYHPELHEFQLTDRGSALIDAYQPVRANLSSIGGPRDGTVLDCVIQELDVKTGQLLWEWHALGHVALTSSYWGHSFSAPYDFFHLNSIQELPNGNLLVSARNTWSVYEIDKQTGRAIWTLGGKRSSFKMGPGTNFEWQHDPRLVGDRLSLFDDGALPQEERQSSAKLLRLDMTSMTAALVGRYRHSPPLLSGVEGSTQVLSNHDVFVGWGDQPVFSEYTAAGRQIFNGSLPLGSNSYRAYRFPWIGRPATRPALAVVRKTSGRIRVFASWNGATQVAAWRVRGGTRLGSLRTLKSASRTGFETAITLTGRPPRYLVAQALNARGKVIGTSRLQKG
jgi:hypothetical protein